MSSKKYFGRIATKWDRMRAAFFSEAVREKAFAVADLLPGRTAADLGAGTGFMTEGLHRKGLRVIAVDQSSAMLGEMKKKFGPRAGIDYRLGDAEALPVENRSVHYVFANMYLHHVERPRKAIEEAVRILKPGGRLIVTDLDEHGFEFLRQEHEDRWLGFKRSDVKRWFQEAGLKSVTVDCVGEECCAQSNSGSEHARISIFVACAEKRASGKEVENRNSR